MLLVETESGFSVQYDMVYAGYTLPPTHTDTHTYLISHPVSRNPGIWEQLSWLVLAQGTSWVYSQARLTNCSSVPKPDEFAWILNFSTKTGKVSRTPRELIPQTSSFIWGCNFRKLDWGWRIHFHVYSHGCWQEASVLCCVYLSAHNMASLRESDARLPFLA